MFDHFLKLALKGLSGIAALFWLSLLQRDNDLIKASVFSEVKKNERFFCQAHFVTSTNLLSIGSSSQILKCKPIFFLK